MRTRAEFRPPDGDLVPHSHPRLNASKLDFEARSRDMDESTARAERLRAMREAASSANADAQANANAPSSTLPAPFVDLGDGDDRTPGFYTGAGASSMDMSLSLIHI